jgi:bidirectional [NiFe] hydrogenase diaphorase subunit
MSKVVTLRINDQDYSGRDDQSVLELAREYDIPIPTLCHIDGLKDIGACRLCLIEVKGVNKLLPACTTLVAEGMEAYTSTPRLILYRRMIIEMLLCEGNHTCSVCVSNGHCELQFLAQSLGVDHLRLPNRFPKRIVDASHERFLLDQNRCVLCMRCVRVCDEVEGAHTWDVQGRGIDSRVITDLATRWGDSLSCTSCGKCVHVCPTGALVEKGKSAGEMTKHGEFLPFLKAMRERRS